MESKASCKSRGTKKCKISIGFGVSKVSKVFKVLTFVRLISPRFEVSKLRTSGLEV